MCNITAVLEPDSDGTVRLSLPPELQRKKVRVTASFEAVEESRSAPRATPEMVKDRLKALEALRAAGGLKDLIADPVAWQREQRQERLFPADT